VLFRIGVEIFNKHVSLMYVQPELKYMVPISRLLAIFCNFTNASERLHSCNWHIFIYSLHYYLQLMPGTVLCRYLRSADNFCHHCFRSNSLQSFTVCVHWIWFFCNYIIIL